MMAVPKETFLPSEPGDRTELSDSNGQADCNQAYTGSPGPQEA